MMWLLKSLRELLAKLLITVISATAEISIIRVSSVICGISVINTQAIRSVMYYIGNVEYYDYNDGSIFRNMGNFSN